MSWLARIKESVLSRTKGISLGQYAQLWLAGEESRAVPARLGQPYAQSLWVYACVSALARNVDPVALTSSTSVSRRPGTGRAAPSPAANAPRTFARRTSTGRPTCERRPAVRRSSSGAEGTPTRAESAAASRSLWL